MRSTWLRRTMSAGTLCALMALLVLPVGTPFNAPEAYAFAPIPGESELDWNQIAAGGITGAANGSFNTLQVYDGDLYAGTSSMLGCNLFRYDGLQWEMLVGEGLPTYRSPGFGNSDNDTISAMAVFDGALYIGVLNLPTGCELWRYYGDGFQKLVGTGRPGDQAPGFGDPDNYSIGAMAAMGDFLYIGTSNDDGCELWRYDGTDFDRYEALGPGLGNPDNYAIQSMIVYNDGLGTGEDALYMGTRNPVDGCEIWRWNGTAMTQLVGPDSIDGTESGFGYARNQIAYAMAEHRANLYVGTFNPDGCQVFQYAGAGWNMTAGPALPGDSGAGFGDTSNIAVRSMVSYGTFLYASTVSTGGGTQVWRTDVAGWYPEADGGLGNANNNPINAMCEYGSTLYAATANWLEGGEVYSAANNFYFAEGYTGTGFQEYLCLGNPETFDADATIIFMFQDGSIQREFLTIPHGYRVTINVNGTVGPDRSVAALVQCDRAISVERPMYFDYTPSLNTGHWTGGHDAVGATSLSNHWYFAEGYTGPGFEEWICVLNPGEDATELTFVFQVEGLEDPVVIDGVDLVAHARCSFLVNQLLGGSYQASLMLQSSQPVVAERPMYFDYLGADPAAPKHWTGGHCVMGAPALANRYYFAEGCTLPNFDEYLTIQNPAIMPITVDAIYQPAAGQGGNIERSYTLMPGARQTLYVPEEAGENKDLSVQLTSAGPFLAERPMYFDYTGYGAPGWTGGHCVIGATETSAEWFFAEGYTGPGFQQWLTLQNPGDDEATVSIDYFTQEEGPLPERTVTVPARARLNVWVNANAGAGYQLSTRLRVTAGPEIVAERPMYFDYGPGWTGGHDVVGLIP